MHENLFLFTGDSPYLLRQELKRRKEQFAAKHGEQNIFSFSADNFDVPVIIDSIFSGGLFVAKKLVIIFGVPGDKISDNKVSAAKLEQFDNWFSSRLEYLSADTVVVFVSYDPDKRMKLYKQLSEIAQVKEFKTPNAPGLKKFLAQLLGDLVSDTEVEYLVEQIGTDMFRLAQEADKLTTYARFHGLTKINKKTIDTVIYTETDANNFAVLDTLLTDKEQTLAQIDLVSANMTDRNEFLGMLYRWIKHMLQTLDLYEQGEKDGKQIASKLWMHPFVISKNMKYIHNISDNKAGLIRMYDELMQLDMSIKSGQFPAEGFYTQVKKMVSTL